MSAANDTNEVCLGLVVRTHHQHEWLAANALSDWSKHHGRNLQLGDPGEGCLPATLMTTRSRDRIDLDELADLPGVASINVVYAENTSEALEESP